MTYKEELGELKDRLSKVELERDTWRTSGMQEKYLEACSQVEALQVQLERLQQQGLARNDEERVMAELAITCQDGIYRLGDLRYDRLADAVNYARLQRLQLRRA